MVQQQVGRTPRQHGGRSREIEELAGNGGDAAACRRVGTRAPTPAVIGAPPPLPAGPPAYDPAWAEPPRSMEPAALEGVGTSDVVV